MRLRAPDRVTRSGDDGFSLVEAVVALAIATAIFTALAFALVGGAKSALLSQQNQQAGDVLNQAVEDARAMSYPALAMRSTDLDVGETGRSPALSGGVYNPSNDSTSGTPTELEPLVLDDNGGIDTHVEQVTQNGGTFTVRRYVTTPADASSAVYKRLTVVVDWSTLGKDRSRTYSTLVADTKRGLPLPDFKFTNSADLSQCRNPGSVATYAFNLKNNGARDGWNLTTTPASPVWSFFADTNGNGAYNSATDAALPVTAAGTPTTGLLEPTTAQTFFAVLELTSTAVPTVPSTVATTFRATSAAQPDYWQELVTSTVVQTGPCGAVTPTASPSPSASPTGPPPTAPAQPAASCASLTGNATTAAPGGTMVRYYPRNPSQPGDTAAALDMPVLRDAGSPPALGDLYNYSTDLHATAGRYLEQGATGTARDLASWTYGMPASSALKGHGEVTLWAAPADGSLTASPSFSMTLDLLTSSGSFLSTLGTATYSTPSSGWGCAGLRPFSAQLVNVGGSGMAVTANQKLRLSVRVTNGVPVRLGYGTSAYPMTMTLPFKTGLG